MLTDIIIRALSGCCKDEVLFAQYNDFNLTKKIVSLAYGAYRDKCKNEIRGSGYVVESLETALWCFLHTDNFEAAILEAANLGDDADTTSAVCGQVAGAFYGMSGIPGRWLSRLVMRQEICNLADRLYNASYIG